jgi:hypothetical protein
MKDRICSYSTAILTLLSLFQGGQISYATTLFTSSERMPSSAYEIEAIYIGEGSIHFDSLAIDLVHHANAITVHDSVASNIVERAPLMALEVFDTNTMSTGGGHSQGNTPTPSAPWLFVSSGLALIGIGYRKKIRAVAYKKVPHLLLFIALTLISPSGIAAPDSNAYLNGDAIVNTQDI